MNNFLFKGINEIKSILQRAFNLKYMMVMVTLFVASNFVLGQGSIPIKAKSFLGALEFLPDGKLADGYSRVKLAKPNDKDPALDPDKWYTEGNDNMRGMIGDAVLFLEWWTLGYSPAERYKFDWVSSGYFELYNTSENPLAPIIRINRSDLAKYPNLLKRFDNITPIDIQFEFTFRTADLPDQEYDSFRKRYKIFESLGSAGYSVSFTRKLDGDFILYKASRKKQDWINPGPIPGGWDTFLNVPANLEDKKSRLIELFKMGRSLVFSNFKISRIKWNMSDFKYIAKKYADYESGKDKPTAFDEVEKGVKENKAGDEFWDETDLVDSETEAFRDQKTGKYGIKTKKGKIVQEPIFDNIVKSAKEKYYIAKNANTVSILNNMGKSTYSKTYAESPSIGSCSDGKLWSSMQTNSSRVGEFNYFVNTNENDFFESGVYSRTVKWYSTYQPMYLTVESASDTRTRSEKDAAERAWKKERERQIDQKIESLKSSGYVSYSQIGCK